MNMSEYANQNYASGQSNSLTPAQPVVQAVANQSFETLQGVHKLLTDLESRLEPYMTAQPPCAGETKGEPNSCSFHGKMMDIRSNAISIRERIGNLISRLQI